jgi:hypothetical protein
LAASTRYFCFCFGIVIVSEDDVDESEDNDNDLFVLGIGDEGGDDEFVFCS